MKCVLVGCFVFVFVFVFLGGGGEVVWLNFDTKRSKVTRRLSITVFR